MPGFTPTPEQQVILHRDPNLDACVVAHSLPEEEPDGGWGRWIIEIAGGEVIPAPSSKLIELLQALEGLTEQNQKLGRYLGQLGILAKIMRSPRVPACASS